LGGDAGASPGTGPNIKPYEPVYSERKFLYYLTILIATGLILPTLVSWVHDVGYRCRKVLDFPPIQYL
jgi:hypothetical protein